MQLSNNANFNLQELRELLSDETYGSAIDLDYREHRYRFSKEGDHIIVNLESDNVGSIYFQSFDRVRFEDWGTEQNVFVEWLDELDAHLYNYSV